jgi:hypothetical protein
MANQRILRPAQNQGMFMRKIFLTAMLCSCLFIAGCANSESSYWDLMDVTDTSKLTVQFSSADVEYQRVSAKRNHDVVGWIESGTWRAADKSEVWVYIATLYDKAFQKKGIVDMQSLARRLSGDSYLEFTNEGEIPSNSGDIDYVFYRASGQPCVLIRKYWSDAETSADASRAIALLWVAGTHVIYAYDCRPSGADLTLGDMQRLFDGIEAKDLYWPGDMFVNSSGAL